MVDVTHHSRHGKESWLSTTRGGSGGIPTFWLQESRRFQTHQQPHLSIRHMAAKPQPQAVGLEQRHQRFCLSGRRQLEEALQMEGLFFWNINNMLLGSIIHNLQAPSRC